MDPERWSGHFWLYVAVGIWIFVKLPQEHWIHVAQLDFTDAVAAHPWFGALCLLGLGVLAWALLLAINFLLTYAGSRTLSDRGHLSVATGLFFAYLTTLIVVLYDTYRPLRRARDALDAPDRGILAAKHQALGARTSAVDSASGAGA